MPSQGSKHKSHPIDWYFQIICQTRSSWETPEYTTIATTAVHRDSKVEVLSSLPHSSTRRKLYICPHFWMVHGCSSSSARAMIVAWRHAKSYATGNILECVDIIDACACVCIHTSTHRALAFPPNHPTIHTSLPMRMHWNRTRITLLALCNAIHARVAMKALRPFKNAHANCTWMGST